MAVDYARENRLSYIELGATNDGAALYRKKGFHETEMRYLPMQLDLI